VDFSPDSFSGTGKGKRFSRGLERLAQSGSDVAKGSSDSRLQLCLAFREIMWHNSDWVDEKPSLSFCRGRKIVFGGYFCALL
jgi:hypothetical protein